MGVQVMRRSDLGFGVVNGILAEKVLPEEVDE